MDYLRDVAFQLRVDPTAESKIIILEAYQDGERGLKNMKKLKQNFRRILSGQSFKPY